MTVPDRYPFRSALVTGATGMVGRQVVSKLLERGVHVTSLLHTVREAGLPDGVSPVHGDIRDRDSLALAAAGAEVVFHLAATVPGAARTEAEYRDVNVTGTANALDAAKKAGALRFVHVSSVNVDLYARGLASDVYSKTKWEAESLVLNGSSGKIECVVVRLAPVFGPGSRRSGRLIESFVRGRVWVLPVPSRRFCPVYSADLGTAIVQAAARGKAGNTYTIAGNCVTLRQFIEELARVSGRRAPRLSIPGWIVTPGLSVAWAVRPVTRWTPPVTVEGVKHGHFFDGSAASRELNFEYTPLDRALAATVEALRLKRA